MKKWTCESGILYCADCVVVMDYLLKKGIFVDLIITSPPYDNLRSYNGYELDFSKIAIKLSEIIKPGGVIIWVVSDQTTNGSESGTSFRQALFFKDKCKLNLHDTMIYKKMGIRYTEKVRYSQQFEYMFVFSKGKPSYFKPIKDVRRTARFSERPRSNRQRDGTIVRNKISYDDGTIVRNKISYDTGEISSTHRNRTNIWEILENTFGVKYHPATFPTELAKDHILSWCPEGALVFDPFMGSGTTAICAEKLDRFWLGCDVSSNYCEEAVKRIKAAEEGFGLHRRATLNKEVRSKLGLWTGGNLDSRILQKISSKNIQTSARTT